MTRVTDILVLSGILAVGFDCICRSQLAGTPHEAHLRLLEVFAYGTYAEAQSKGDELPTLTPPQVRAISSAFAFFYRATYTNEDHVTMYSNQYILR